MRALVVAAYFSSFFFFFWTFGSLIPTPWISIFSPLPTLLSSKRETSIRCIILPPLSCNFIISASDWMTRSMFLNLSPLSSRTVSSYKCWGIRTCIYPANLPLSVYCCILNKLFSRKYAVLSNPRRVNNISSSVVSSVTLPMYKSSIRSLCMFFLLLLTRRVHSDWSLMVRKRRASFDLFFPCFVCSSFSDICSWFDVFLLFFLSFTCSVFFLGWRSALKA